MSNETVIVVGVLFILPILIDGFLIRQSLKRFTAEYRRFNEKLDAVEEKMDQIAIPLLTSKVLFPEDEGFYYPEEGEE